MATAEQWLGKLANLKVDKARGDPAPHKPLLLLATSWRSRREARFRLNIVAAYNYTCALTRYRLTTIAGGSIVDAAHIHVIPRMNYLQPPLAARSFASREVERGFFSL